MSTTTRIAGGLAVLAAVALATGPGVARAADGAALETVPVIMPDGDNLQYLAFWVALGSGMFSAHGVEPHLVVPEVPAQAIASVIKGDAPMAVLPPPVYLELISERVPIELVANLLQNDPINLVVRRSVFDARHMNAAAPLRDRLESMRGLRIGVAPGPPTRLRALFASVGLDADQVAKIVVRQGKDQNDAFANDQCDALYAHTPYLEKAIDDQDAVMLVNQSGGDVPQLAMRQIHALTASRDFLASKRATVLEMVRAIAQAETLVKADPDAAEEAVMRAIPALDRRHVHTIVGLYRPAVPETPRVDSAGLAPALALFPASRRAPSLEGVSLGDFVAPDVAAEAMGTGGSGTSVGGGASAGASASPSAGAGPSMVAKGRWAALAVLAVALVGSAVFAFARRRRIAP